MATYSLMMDDGNAINSSGVAVFITKVWRIVEDPEYQHLISWSENGKTVLVHDYSQFSKDILPQYFKHCNFNSFVRQLNLYGFRKVTKADQGSLLKAQAREPIEFWHPHFRRGHPEQLPDVQRRPVANKVAATAGAEEKTPPQQLAKVVSDVHQINRRQESITTTLEIMKQENAHLRQEVSTLKDKHEQQQKVLDKIIQFLLHMVYKGGISQKRKQPPLMLMDSGTPSKKQKMDDKDLFAYEPTVETMALNSQPYLQQQLSESSFQPLEMDPRLPHSSHTEILPAEDPVQSPDHLQALLSPPYVDMAPSPSPTASFNLDLIPELPITTSASYMPLVSTTTLPTAVLSSINDRISSQQTSIDAIHELLATGSTFTIDPTIFNEYMTADINYTPGYDTVDTACLLESLSGGDDDVPTNGYSIEPVISSHLEDTTMDPYSALRELLETSPAHITDTTTATSTISTVRNKQ